MVLLQGGVRIVGLVAGLVGISILARNLDKSEFGEFTLYLTILGIATALTELGLTNAAVREYAAQPSNEEEIAGALLVGRVATSVIAFAGAALTLVLLADDPSAAPAGVLVVATILLAPLTTGQAWGQANLRVGTQNALLLAQSTLWPIGIIVVSLTSGGLTTYAIVFAVVTAANALAVFVTFKRGIRPTFGHVSKWLRVLLRTALPLALSGLFITMYYRVSGVILYQSNGAVASAEFAAGLRVIDAMQAIPATLLVVVLPLLARSFSNDDPSKREARIRLFSLAARGILIVAVPIAIGGALVAPNLLRLLYGEPYASAGPQFAMLLLAFPAICLGYVFMSAALAGKETRALGAITGVASLANLLAALILIPRFGGAGAASITLMTEWVVVLAVGTMLRRRLHLKVEAGPLVRLGVAALAMCLAILPFRDQPLYWVIPLGAVVYLVAAAAIDAISMSDLRQLFNKAEVIA